MRLESLRLVQLIVLLMYGIDITAVQSALSFTPLHLYLLSSLSTMLFIMLFNSFFASLYWIFSIQFIILFNLCTSSLIELPTMLYNAFEPLFCASLLAFSVQSL